MDALPEFEEMRRNICTSGNFSLMVTKEPIVSDRERGKIKIRWATQLVNPPTIGYSKLNQSIPPQK